ncbi:SUMF1/EgtB/PvdO family nonheme iron enzyme [Streptomyces sp. NPDC096324]|uniref:SUMF1/EgtB/PvdO family nonheme iron enzyme n=1 Tax=Streptomyces sp. NPDC096324 TaxID=3366085 RepID=UPI0038161D1B
MTTIAQRSTTAPVRGTAWIEGGLFLMGSDDFYPEERPVHPVSVDGFWMDEHPVTVAAFRRFVKATGYVTVAERPLEPGDYPGADAADLVPGALVFQMPRGPVDLNDWRHGGVSDRARPGGIHPARTATSRGESGTR